MPQKRFTLLIVDPQIDFISGSLAVADGAKAMDWLALFVRTRAEDIEAVVVTMDQHPANHCSFMEQGGLWPSHCVRYSLGAAIYPPLFDSLEYLRGMGIVIRYIEKAVCSDRDAYSAFETEIPEQLQKATLISVAGIAGDFCVKQSVTDLQKHGLSDKLHLLDEGIAFIHKD